MINPVVGWTVLHIELRFEQRASRTIGSEPRLPHWGRLCLL